MTRNLKPVRDLPVKQQHPPFPYGSNLEFKPQVHESLPPLGVGAVGVGMAPELEVEHAVGEKGQMLLSGVCIDIFYYNDALRHARGLAKHRGHDTAPGAYVEYASAIGKQVFNVSNFPACPGERQAVSTEQLI